MLFCTLQLRFGDPRFLRRPHLSDYIVSNLSGQVGVLLKKTQLLADKFHLLGQRYPAHDRVDVDYFWLDDSEG